MGADTVAAQAPDWFRAELNALLPQLRRYAHSLARNVTDGEDLFQDTCLRALERWYQFQQGTFLKSWLFTIMRNQFYTHCTTESRRRAMDCALYEQRCEYGEEDGEDAAVSIITLKEVTAAIRTLSPKDRMMLGIGIGDEAYAEVAARLEVADGTIKSGVHRARERLAARLAGGRATSGRGARDRKRPGLNDTFDPHS